MDRSVEIAIEWTARKGVRRLAGSVELELIDAVIPDHIDAGIAEALVVHRTRQRETVRVGLEALRFSVCNSLLVRLTVAAPRRHPHSVTSSVLARGRTHFSEPLRETG